MEWGIVGTQSPLKYAGPKNIFGGSNIKGGEPKPQP